MSEYIRQRQVLYKGEVTIINQSEYLVLQSTMFMQVWRERMHKCAITGIRLYNPLSYLFHHILEKRNYELYSLCKWNIVLLDKPIHDSYETKPDTVSQLVELKQSLLNKIDDKRYKYDNDALWKVRSKNRLADITPGYAPMGRRIPKGCNLQW